MLRRGLAGIWAGAVICIQACNNYYQHAPCLYFHTRLDTYFIAMVASFCSTADQWCLELWHRKIVLPPWRSTVLLLLQPRQKSALMSGRRLKKSRSRLYCLVAGSKNQGVGKWVPSITRFIACTQLSFFLYHESRKLNSTRSSEQHCNWTTLEMNKFWKTGRFGFFW